MNAGSGRGDEGRIGHDDEIRPGDDAALVVRLAGRPHVGRDRCAAPFRPIAWRILHFESGAEERGTQHTARAFDALSATAMEANAEHAWARFRRSAIRSPGGPLHGFLEDAEPPQAHRLLHARRREFNRRRARQKAL